MAVIDIVLGALILFGLIRGLFKGLFVELASVIALVAGVYGAIHFSYFVANFLETKTEWDEKTINITAFAITFVVIILLISLAGKALTKLADFGEDLGYTNTAENWNMVGSASISYLDSPSSTSALVYKTQGNNNTATGSVRVQNSETTSTLTLIEIGA